MSPRKAARALAEDVILPGLAERTVVETAPPGDHRGACYWLLVGGIDESSGERVARRERERLLALALGRDGRNLRAHELRVALEVWLERFPDFSLTDSSAVVWGGTQSHGPKNLPLRIR